MYVICLLLICLSFLCFTVSIHKSIAGSSLYYFSLKEWGYFQVCFESGKKSRRALNFYLDLFSWTSLHWASLKKKNLLLGSIALSESVWLWAVLTQSHSLSVNWGWFSLLLLGSALPPKFPQTPRIGHTQLEMAYLFLLQLHFSCCSLVSGWFSQGTFSAISHT